jgi:hypothetical protein
MWNPEDQTMTPLGKRFYLKSKSAREVIEAYALSASYQFAPDGADIVVDDDWKRSMELALDQFESGYASQKAASGNISEEDYAVAVLRLLRASDAWCKVMPALRQPTTGRLELGIPRSKR